MVLDTTTVYSNRNKKGQYVRRIKESLWSTFGISRIRPFEDNFTKEQMKEWKRSENVKKVHKDLYSLVNPQDSHSETYKLSPKKKALELMRIGHNKCSK